MSLLQIALDRDGLRPLEDQGDLGRALERALDGLAPEAPVVVMVHGKGYRPGRAGCCPHRILYAERRDQGQARSLSWPRRLGLAGEGRLSGRGLALGFGWDSSGDLWTAARAAERAGPELAGLIGALRRLDPGRRVDLIGHSLGVRVMLGALPLLEAGAVGRMILLAGAEFADRAQAALQSSAGRAAEVINVLSRENDLFDWMFETALAPLSGRRALGAGLHGLPQAVNVQIDGAEARQALAGLGFRLPEPRFRICHWSVYLRPGVFRLYRGLIHRRGELPLDRLRAALAVTPEPRWARLGRTGLPSAVQGHSFPA